MKPSTCNCLRGEHAEGCCTSRERGLGAKPASLPPPPPPPHGLALRVRSALTRTALSSARFSELAKGGRCDMLLSSARGSAADWRARVRADGRRVGSRPRQNTPIYAAPMHGGVGAGGGQGRTRAATALRRAGG
eukprot:361330-Chlamydomonas_euryale.AAC.6